MNAKLEICKQCDKFNSTTKMCGICYCFMPAKTLMPFATCPLGKWKILETKGIDNEIRKNN